MSDDTGNTDGTALKQIPQAPPPPPTSAQNTTTPLAPLEIGKVVADKTADDQRVSDQQWERIAGQRDVLIAAMTRIFAGLNGSVLIFVFCAWIGGFFLDQKNQIIDGKTVAALIAATAAQAGVAFIIIVKNLFPTGDKPQ